MSHEDTLILEIDADVYAKIAAIAAREGTDIDRMIRDMVRAVSYTHLDVYKRQCTNNLNE